MGLPDKSSKHIPVHQPPVGATRKGKMKIQDGDTKKVSWRSGKHGFLRDYDGDPIATNYSNRDMKVSHKVHGGAKTKADGNAPQTGGLPDDPSDSE